MKIKIAVLLQCILLGIQSVSAVNIEMVTVGNPGNAPDMRNTFINPEGFGAVNYVYQIGKYEITNGQYTEFLNAVAKDDPNELYNPLMAHPVGRYPNIVRSGQSPNFSYSVALDWVDRPVSYVSFWDAARFANWLHNAQPTGPQGPGTTEDGAYHDVGDQTLFGRNASARFFIPTEDEWYKAAYHDTTAGLDANYFDYPMGTNVLPGNDITETTKAGNNANYYVGNYSIGYPYYFTSVGEFELSSSPYGTFDQAGNVFEWNETKVTASSRGMRGGEFGSNEIPLRASSRFNPSPEYESFATGFRIAAAAPIPEPTSHLLFSIAAMMLGGSRRHR